MGAIADESIVLTALRWRSSHSITHKSPKKRVVHLILDPFSNSPQFIHNYSIWFSSFITFHHPSVTWFQSDHSINSMLWNCLHSYLYNMMHIISSLTSPTSDLPSFYKNFNLVFFAFSFILNLYPQPWFFLGRIGLYLWHWLRLVFSCHCHFVPTRSSSSHSFTHSSVCFLILRIQE
jgi:hypothetical protein